MKTSSSTRRSFLQTAGAAFSVPLAAAATVPVSAAGDGGPLNARLAHLEDVEAIRALNLEFARRVNTGDHADIQGVASEGFGEEDMIDIAPDRQAARATLHCTVQLETEIGPSCTLVEMAREQGCGIFRRTERAVLEHEYVRRDGAWKILRSAHRVLLLAIIAVIGVPALSYGQWLHYPTEGIPRKPDGNPNLTAPAPRLPDGKPDLSGLWHAAQARQCVNSAGVSIPCGIEIGGSPLGGNLGRNLPGGSLPYQPWAAKAFEERHAAMSIDDPHVRCLPDNPPRAWTLPHLTKAIHNPKLLVLLYEVNAMYRQIFIDGRPLPKDPNPTWNGYSAAHWEGDTLVVQTEGFRDNLWIDTWGSPMSDVAKMTEKIRRPNFGTLEIELDDRRSEGLHEAVHRQPDGESRTRHGTGRRVLPRGRERLRAAAAIARQVRSPHGNRNARCVRRGYRGIRRQRSSLCCRRPAACGVPPCG